MDSPEYESEDDGPAGNGEGSEDRQQYEATLAEYNANRAKPNLTRADLH